jgi:hypothetical protein
MERAGTDAEIKENDEQSVVKQSAQVAQAPEASWRRPNRRIEQGDSPHATEASGEFDVLHEWDVREAAHLLENIGLDEDRLVAEKRPRRCADAPHQPLPPLHPEVPVVKLPMKRSAYYSVSLASGSQRGKVLWPQLGIRVMEAQQRAVRFHSSGVHLCSARGLVAND